MIGQFIFRNRWALLIAWVVLAGAIALLAPKPDASVGETGDLLPSDTPVHIALDEYARRFGSKAALSEMAIVFERQSGPLTPSDMAAVESIAARLKSAGKDVSEFSQISVLSPRDLLIAGHNPLVSDDGRAALIRASLPFNFITREAARVVKTTQEIVKAYALPAGLTASVTGSAGYGYDYAIATERSHTKTTVVTIIAVVIILLSIYRAPLAAMIPLSGISLAAAFVLNLLSFGERIGLHNGMAERIFTFVLLYGAGIDYSVLFISRYREFLHEGDSPADAIAKGLNASLSATISSAVMTIAGMAMLCFGRFSIFRHAGPAVMLAVAASAVAAITVVPAVLAIVGPRAFWPQRLAAMKGSPTPILRRSAWTPVAAIVVKYPLFTILATLALLVPPAVRGAGFNWNYDALTSLKSTYPARQGTEAVQRHWPIGETAPVTLLAVADAPMSIDAWRSLADRMADGLKPLPAVRIVRTLQKPLGSQLTFIENIAVQAAASERIKADYVSADGLAMKLSIVMDLPPLTRAAMTDVSTIGDIARRAVADARVPARVYLLGQTAEMIDMRDITHADFHRIAAMALIAILVLISIVLRDVLLASFILGATVLSYLTTLGLTYWFFTALGEHGLEWKVQMLLFMVLVAVGQDYSIFFAVRYAQEARNHPCVEATRRAVVFTGPVISSCGLIMAATLGSVMAGDVTTLVQMGFAFALGMLIDTFLVRPLLLPAFIVLTRRTLSKAHVYA